MKLTASYFSPSLPLFKENLRRFWVLSLLSFLAYFFALAFPILMNFSQLPDMWGYINMSLKNANPIISMAHGFFPVMISVLIFRYLNSVNSVTVIHAMPYTRQKLFITNMLSGLFLITLPLILNGLILMGISANARTHDYSGDVYFPMVDGITLTPVDLIGYGDILAWVGTSLIAIFFIYSIALLAGLVTGNPLMHFAMACLFNFLIPLLLSVSILYSQEFFWNYAISESFTNLILSFSPLLNVFNVGPSMASAELFSPLYMALYLIASIAIMALTVFLYEKRKLERAGDSLVFTFMNPIVCYSTTFLGMTAFGFIFSSINYDDLSNTNLYIGFLIGTMLTFIIVQMMIKKTPRIFNLKSLRDLTIYGILAVIFVSIFSFDLTGYEKRVPSVENAKYAYFDERVSRTIDPMSLGDYEQTYAYDGIIFKDPENIAHIQAFHKEIIEKYNSNPYDKYPNVPLYDSSYLQIYYDFGKGAKNQRDFLLPQSFLLSSKSFNKLFESKEWKDTLLYSKSNVTKMNNINLITSGFLEYNNIYLNQADMMDGFMTAFDKDIESMTYAEYTSFLNPYCNVEIYFDYKHPDDEYARESQILDVTVRRSFTNTIKWIEDNGYGHIFTPSIDNIENIEMEMNGVNLTITEPAEIIEILNTHEISEVEHVQSLDNVLSNDGYNTTFNESYITGRVFTKSTISNSYSHYSSDPESNQNYYSTPQTAEIGEVNITSYNIYYTDKNTAPDFLIKKFEEAKND